MQCKKGWQHKHCLRMKVKPEYQNFPNIVTLIIKHHEDRSIQGMKQLCVCVCAYMCVVVCVSAHMCEGYVRGTLI